MKLLAWSHTWLRWCSMIPNVHITVRQNGFRINVWDLPSIKGLVYEFCFVYLSDLSDWLMAMALSFFVSYLFPHWPGEMWLSCRGAGVVGWTVVDPAAKGTYVEQFRRVLWWHAGTWLSKWPAGHQKWHKRMQRHQHANHTHLPPA